MRTNIGLSLAGLLVVTAVASAQYPYQGGTGYGTPYGSSASGPYGGQQYGGSPLSPYLNLAGRGTAGAGLPGVNFFNFVRPNLPNANRMGLSAPGAMGGAMRSSYFPTLQSLDEENLPGQQRTHKKDAAGLEKTQLPPTGHAAGFSNSLGYFGPMMAGPGGGAAGSAGRNPSSNPSSSPPRPPR